MHTSSNTGVLRFAIRLAYQQEGGFMQLNVDCVYYRDELSDAVSCYISRRFIHLRRFTPSQEDELHISDGLLVPDRIIRPYIYTNRAINVNSPIVMDAHLSKS